MLRTTQNKIYRQGMDTRKNCEQGFPATVDELFSYQAIIIGGVEANYFTPTQQELLKQFVDRRGGGSLARRLGNGLADGGWERSSVADLLPVNSAGSEGYLPSRSGECRTHPSRAREPDLPAGR